MLWSVFGAITIPFLGGFGSSLQRANYMRIFLYKKLIFSDFIILTWFTARDVRPSAIVAGNKCGVGDKLVMRLAFHLEAVPMGHHRALRYVSHHPALMNVGNDTGTYLRFSNNQMALWFDINLPRHFGSGYRQEPSIWHTVEEFPSNTIPSLHLNMIDAPSMVPPSMPSNHPL